LASGLHLAERALQKEQRDMKRAANPFHPDLQRAARLIPNVTANRPLLAVMRFIMRLQPALRVPEDVAVED
jgi:hypothetical protein